LDLKATGTSSSEAWEHNMNVHETKISIYLTQEFKNFFDIMITWDPGEQLENVWFTNLTRSLDLGTRSA